MTNNGIRKLSTFVELSLILKINPKANMCQNILFASDSDGVKIVANFRQTIKRLENQLYPLAPESGDY